MIVTESPVLDKQKSGYPPGVVERLTLDNQVVVRRALGLVAAGLLGWATFVAWGSIVTLPAVGFLAACTFLLLGCAALAMLVVSAKWLVIVETAILALACAILVGWAIGALYGNPQYGTDEAAFIQGSAQLALSGHNPYTANLLPFFQLFRVPEQFGTFLLNGGVSSALAYPAGSFIIVEPFVLLTHGTQAVVIASLVCFIASTILSFVLLPATWRMVGVIAVAASPILFAFALSGLGAIMCLPFLIVVAARWQTPALHSRLTLRAIVQAVMLGLACAISQVAWFIAIFLLVGLLRTALHHTSWSEAIRRVTWYFAIALGVFILVNIPWILADPSAWVRGILLPITQNAIPYGQGLIDLSVNFHIGGGSLAAFSLLGDMVVLALFVGYWIWFDSLPSALWILPGIALWFPTRSLASYFTVLAPLWIVGYLGELRVSRETLTLTRRSLNRRLLATALLFAPLVGVSWFALSAPAPLHLRLLHTESNGEFGGIWKFSVRVANTSSSTVHHPEFSVNASGHASSFWIQTKGPNELKPHTSAVFGLESPNVGSMPGITQPFSIQVVSAAPGSVSVSSTMTPEPFATYLSPNSVGRVLTPGQKIWFKVALRSPYGAIVKKANVRIALGQIIYAQQGLVLSDARINGAPYGQTPVYARTNTDGIALFHVTAPRQSSPIYFQSWVSERSAYPFGYSETVSILWR